VVTNNVAKLKTRATKHNTSRAIGEPCSNWFRSFNAL